MSSFALCYDLSMSINMSQKNSKKRSIMLTLAFCKASMCCKFCFCSNEFFLSFPTFLFCFADRSFVPSGMLYLSIII
uniref:Uncharacterized protein n=1 Tax=Zea mays TaxID=4577 RepID=C4IZD3_MAIZE|nr:unknown [Zea mays]